MSAGGKGSCPVLPREGVEDRDQILVRDKLEVEGHASKELGPLFPAPIRISGLNIRKSLGDVV